MAARRIKDNENIEETRHTILAAAKQLFMEYGYRAVSTRQIAHQSSISQPTLYYHFADKQAIFAEICLQLLRRMRGELEQLTFSSNPPAERLVEAARFLLRYASREMNVNSMLHDIEHELNEATKKAISEAFFVSVVQPLVVIIEANREALGGSKTSNLSPVTLATLFLSMVTTLTDQTSDFDRQKLSSFSQPEDMAEQLVQFYLHGLAG